MRVITLLCVCLALGARAATVRTSSGWVSGVESVSSQGTIVHQFRGIPYAVPPTGMRRWTAPVPASRWDGERDASQFGSECLQPNWDFKSLVGSEDCLFINVWSPQLPSNDSSASPLPVFVWIHGGGFIELSGNMPGYMPTPDSTAAINAVVFSFNYRLLPMGFLALEMLSQESPTGVSGNYGLMDCVLALRWVQENALNFGGDPNAVTIFGQSAGGGLVLALVTSPLASGLFHRAISMSGISRFNGTLAEAETQNLGVLATTKCQNTTCLRMADAGLIFEGLALGYLKTYGTYNKYQMNAPRQDFHSAIQDGYVLPDDPYNIFANGFQNNVDILIGNVAQEPEFTPGVNISAWTWDEYYNNVATVVGTYGPNATEQVWNFYGSNSVWNGTVERAWATGVADVIVTCSNHLYGAAAAQALAADSKSVYRYVMTGRPSSPITILNQRMPDAGHMWDSVIFFNDTQAFGFDPQPSDIALGAVLQQIIYDFIRDPSSLDWDTYPDETLVIGQDGATEEVDAYHGDECAFWQSVGAIQIGAYNG